MPANEKHGGWRRSFPVNERRGGGVPFTTATAFGQVYNQTIGSVYLGGAISARGDLSGDIGQRMTRVWSCFRRYNLEPYDRPSARLLHKVRMLKAEVCHRDSVIRVRHVEPELQ